MVDEALQFLRDNLNASLSATSGRPANASDPELVRFVDGEKLGESISFPSAAVSVLLVNLEEESSLRPGDPFVRQAADGTHQRVQPDIRLNLVVLFVANFKDYSQSLRYLSRIIQYFQSHRAFHPGNSPTLSPRIEQLHVQLMPLAMTQLNELWGSLRTCYRPSVLYKVRMLTFRDTETTPTSPTTEVQVRIQA